MFSYHVQPYTHHLPTVHSFDSSSHRGDALDLYPQTKFLCFTKFLVRARCEDGISNCLDSSVFVGARHGPWTVVVTASAGGCRVLAVVHGDEVARQAQEGHAPRSRRHHYGGTCATISYSSACQRQVWASFFAASVAFRVHNHELLGGRSCNDFFLIFSSGFSSVQAPDIKRHPKKNSKSHSEHIHESLSDSASAVPGLFPLQRNQGNSRHFSPKSHEVADRGFARFPELLISKRFRSFSGFSNSPKHRAQIELQRRTTIAPCRSYFPR